jgi:transposase-like protein
MIEVIDAAGARRALAAGRLACPSCGGTLRPWGRTRNRAVATPHTTMTVRLHRARCRSCQGTHVLLPAELLARRSYPLQVIGAALSAGGQGGGSRSAATRLGVPASTVRSWLRRARANTEALYRLGVQTVVALEPDLLPTTPRATPLGDALEALAAAASVIAARSAPAPSIIALWPAINVLTRGRLLAPRCSP